MEATCGALLDDEVRGPRIGTTELGSDATSVVREVGPPDGSEQTTRRGEEAGMFVFARAEIRLAFDPLDIGPDAIAPIDLDREVDPEASASLRFHGIEEVVIASRRAQAEVVTATGMVALVEPERRREFVGEQPGGVDDDLGLHHASSTQQA